MNFTDPSGLINPQLLASGVKDLSGGILTVVGGTVLTATGLPFNVAIGVGSVIYGTEKAATGVVNTIIGLISDSPINVPNPSLVYNTTYLATKNHGMAAFSHDLTGLLLGVTSSGLMPPVTTLEKTYFAVDSADSLWNIYSTVRSSKRRGDTCK